MRIALAILLLCAGVATAEEIRVLTWNVESDRHEGAGQFLRLPDISFYSFSAHTRTSPFPSIST